MKIFVPKITSSGLTVPLNMKQDWFATLVTPYLNDPLIQIDPESLQGQLHISNHKGEADIEGGLKGRYDCSCARCGESLKDTIEIQWNMHLSPWKATTTENISKEDENEIELSVDDLNFSFYKNDEIDLAPLINDELALSFPYNHYCADENACSKRAQAQLSQHTPKTIDPRWETLKHFKPKS